MPVYLITGTTGTTEGQQQQNNTTAETGSNITGQQQKIRHKTETGRNMKQTSGNRQKRKTADSRTTEKCFAALFCVFSVLCCPVFRSAITGQHNRKQQQQIRQPQTATAQDMAIYRKSLVNYEYSHTHCVSLVYDTLNWTDHVQLLISQDKFQKLHFIMQIPEPGDGEIRTL